MERGTDGKFIQDWRKRDRLLATLRNIEGREQDYPGLKEKIKGELKKMRRR